MIAPSVRLQIDQHIIAAQAMLYRNIIGGSFEVMPNWVRGYSGLQQPEFNSLMPLNPAGLTDETLADTDAFYYSKKVHYAVDIIHDRLPQGPDFLTQRDYQPLPPQPAMLLQQMPDNIAVNDEIIFERVATVPTLTAFCTILHEVFDFPYQNTLKRFPVARLKDERIRHYLAFINGQPVGAGTVMCAEGVSSVWDICTLDQFRRQGVAMTLLNHMLQNACLDGQNLAVLYSSVKSV
jgi:hypothetical protein